MSLSYYFYTILIVLPLIFSCKKDVPEIAVEEENLNTENVIIIVMDGARYIETWGDPSHQYIPKLANYIKPKGVVNDHFFNAAYTYTSPGHLAMVSGQYYNINNGGGELPPFPTIFQYFNEKYPEKNSWIIASKDKLEVLTNTSDSTYNNQYLANTDCGINGLGSGYREDSVTFDTVMNVLNREQVNLMLINFKGPDAWGHANNWPKYLDAIQTVDDYIYQISQLIATSPLYKDKTTLFITCDHGRHDDNNGGFQNHGDACEGCRHIMFFSYGPDFYSNKVVTTHYELIDIAATSAKLLNVELPNSDGIVMNDLYK